MPKINTIVLESSIEKSLHKLYRKYERRLNKLDGHIIKPKQAFSIVTGGVSAGATVGSGVAFGPGTAIGAVCGLGVGILIVGGIAAYRYRLARKLRHAQEMTEKLGDAEDRKLLFKAAAKAIVNEREEVLQNIQSSNAHKVAKFLALHAMAGLKHDPVPRTTIEETVDALVQGVVEQQSHKANRMAFFSSYKDIAKNQRTQAPQADIVAKLDC
jgi:hypothetical protein